MGADTTTRGKIAEPFHADYCQAKAVDQGDVIVLDGQHWTFAEVMFVHEETVERSAVKVVRWQLRPWPNGQGESYFAVRGWWEPMRVLVRDADL